MSPFKAKHLIGLCVAFSALLIASFSNAQQHRLSTETNAVTSPSAPRLVRTDNVARIHHDVDMMGTVVSFIVVSDHRDQAMAAIRDAELEMRRIVSLLSDWEPAEHQGDVARINRNAGQQPVVVAQETFRLLQAAQELSRKAQGKFDISYAALGQLWQFKPTGEAPRLPNDNHVRTALTNVDYREIKLDATARTVRFGKPAMRIGLGGIAKGYAVDRAVQILKTAGFDDFVVNAGGDLAIVAKLNTQRDEDAEEDALWRVGIRHPRDKQQLVALLPAANISVATSGDYERFIKIDGTRYAHILDPATGYPARQCQSVTVLATRTYLADALATAVFVLGPDKGMQLVEREAGVEALIIDANGELHWSSGLADSAANTGRLGSE